MVKENATRHVEGGQPHHVVLVFVDGLGWGEPDPSINPCHTYGGDVFRLPSLPTEPVDTTSGGWAVPIDPILGVAGIPQSATGQTTLLTGVNAQALLGKHLTGFPNESLRQLLLEHSLLKRLIDRGLVARFLNVFRPLFFELPRERQLRLSATTVANLAAGNRFYDLDDLRARRAIYQEFTNQNLRDKGFDVPLFSPTEAGYILGRRAREHDFLFYEYFLTDHAGHSQDPELAGMHLERLDAFMTALLAELGLAGGGHEAEAAAGCGTAPGAGDTAARILVLLTSDHGNIEDLSTKRHTLNRVPLMAWGWGAERIVQEVRELSGVAPAIRRLLLP